MLNAVRDFVGKRFGVGLYQYKLAPNHYVVTTKGPQRWWLTDEVLEKMSDLNYTTVTGWPGYLTLKTYSEYTLAKLILD